MWFMKLEESGNETMYLTLLLQWSAKNKIHECTYHISQLVLLERMCIPTIYKLICKNSTLDLPVCIEHRITNCDGAFGRHQFRSLLSVLPLQFTGKHKRTHNIIILLFCWRCEIHFVRVRQTKYIFTRMCNGYL